MFSSGRVFLAACAAVEETADGSADVAVLVLGAEIVAPAAAAARDGGDPPAPPARGPLAAAAVADAPCRLGDRLFCVGNPSNIDLESRRRGTIEFEPPTWHASVGRCEGYEHVGAQAARAAQDARGRGAFIWRSTPWRLLVVVKVANPYATRHHLYSADARRAARGRERRADGDGR